MTGITREQAAKVAGEYLGSSTFRTGGYDKHYVLDASGRSWSFVSDASIKTERKISGRLISVGREYAVEFVTPICTYADIEPIQEIVRRLRAAGAIVNTSCGIHVHVDGANFTPKSLKNLMNIFYSKQDMLYQALEVGADRTRYCKKLTDSFIQDINKRKKYTMEQLAEKWYGLLGDSSTIDRQRSTHYNSSRYHGINLHSAFSAHTVEFRCFNSTLHAGKIKAYIQLCLAVAAQSINQNSALARRTESTNPRFTFRTWLLHLGLIGKEFETARLHLLSKLDGNSAWRYKDDNRPVIRDDEEDN